MNTPHPYIRTDGRVLAAIDESAYTDSVCSHAVWAAQRLGAPLEFVHVLGRQEQTPRIDLSGNLGLGEREQLLEELSDLDERRGKLAQERGRLLLQHARGRATEAGVADADTRMRHGALVDNLVEVESDVRLFVVGKRGGHADVAKGHLGSQLERVVRGVHRPLLVASRDFRTIARVLIAFDGSATTRKCVEMVAASPLCRGLDAHVVMAGDQQRPADLEWAAGVLGAAGFDPTVRFVQGEPEEVISGYVASESVDLLVMGAYGHSRIRQLIVGSTTTAMLRNCRIPVLLLR